MKYKLLSLTAIASFVIICATVNAEELGKCKTMLNGQCTEYYAPVGSMQNQCKTMQNGECIEFYRASIHENNYIQEKVDMQQLNKPEQSRFCNNSFGFDYILDPYANVWSTWDVYNQSKVFIIHIDSNSPASQAGLNIGDEITRVNDIRVVKFKPADFSSYFDGQTAITLEVKSIKGGKKSVSLKKAEMCQLKQTEPFFESYWKQVCPYDLDYTSEYLSYIGRISNKLTLALKSEYATAKQENNDWKNKRNQFRTGFNLCLANSYNREDVNNCLNQLVNRSLNNIAHEQSLETQRSAIQAQQQMQQQQVDALNNYSHALKNQHLQVDGTINTNVHHSGTVDHNINGNVNVNGTYNHYYRGW